MDPRHFPSPKYFVFPLQRLFSRAGNVTSFLKPRSQILPAGSVQHAHLSFHGKCGPLPAIVINILGVQKQCSRFFQPHRLPRNLLRLVRTAEIFQIENQPLPPFYAVFLIRAVDGAYRVLFFVPWSSYRSRIKAAPSSSDGCRTHRVPAERW